MEKKVIFAALVIVGVLFVASTITGFAVLNKNIAKDGDFVSIDYTLKLGNGFIIDTTNKTIAEQAGIQKGSYGAIIIPLGTNYTFPKLEEAIIGMKVGETKTVTLEPKDAYGEWNQSLVFNFSKEVIGGEPTKGQRVSYQNVQGIITDIINNTVYVDFNNPLAGQTLIYEITLTGIWKRV